nr:immunoglobulin heavy chain junction region [Macaca mulatta]MOW19724.1 immunoglobulin heavy chain junction region [Macaca mulatta]MOW21607.1 immunoglobulin heavy chain junction region [Macaca mulatta]MOW22274.1 immunoglobulin heavy chain junction region [Macaca mulatta]
CTALTIMVGGGDSLDVW